MKLIVLCGGKGSRLGSLTKEKPKPLVEISGRKIIDAVLSHYGDYEYYFSVGYKGTQMNEYICMNYPGSYCFSEKDALGTGGAVREVASMFKDEYFGVINCDTIFGFNLNFVEYSLKLNCPDVIACPIIGINKITSEYQYSGSYVFKRDFLKYIPETPCSLDRAIKECGDKALYQHSRKLFLDLGTPAGLDEFKRMKTDDRKSQNPVKNFIRGWWN